MDRDKELYERQIEIVDTPIDKLVYELYGLTEAEVNVMEKSLDLNTNNLNERRHDEFVRKVVPNPKARNPLRKEEIKIIEGM